MPTRTRHGYARCPDCRRHVMAPGAPADLQCPFCATPSPGRRTRTALLAGALALAGCGATEADPADTPAAETPSDPGQESPVYQAADDPTMADVYGAPPEDDVDIEEEDEPADID